MDWIKAKVDQIKKIRFLPTPCRSCLMIEGGSCTLKEWTLNSNYIDFEAACVEFAAIVWPAKN